MQKINTLSIRLCRLVAKLFYLLVWRILRLFAKKPVIETVYQCREDAASVVYCCHSPAYIEPESGFIITERGYILEDSMTPNFAFPKRPFKTTVPSPFRFFRAVRASHVIPLETAVSLRHSWEWNYYHFYLDVLGKAELFQMAGISDRLPVVLARYANSVPFVRPLIERGKFRDRKWIVPDSEYVRAEKIFFCHTRTAYGPRVQYLLDALQAETESAESAPNPERRVYLTRSGNRRISNQEALLPILERHSFQVLDTAQMSIEEQMALFRGIRYLIVNHGAGTTNILFRGKAPLTLLELHHENLINYDHKRMCEELCYQWDHLEGKMGHGVPAHADFSVSPEKLEQKILSMLAKSPDLSCV